MIPVLAPSPTRWECQYCTFRVETRPSALTPMHPCRGLNGFRVPLIPYGSNDRVTLVERGDYINGDDVQLDANGRPFMRAEVERADGHSDVWVYAPVAHFTGKAQ
jgi:hypothetical protein